MKFGQPKFDGDNSESRECSARENLDQLDNCLQQAIAECQAQYVECERLNTHNEKMACIGNANTALMEKEGKCFASFRGG